MYSTLYSQRFFCCFGEHQNVFVISIKNILPHKNKCNLLLLVKNVELFWKQKKEKRAQKMFFLDLTKIIFKKLLKKIVPHCFFYLFVFFFFSIQFLNTNVRGLWTCFSKISLIKSIYFKFKGNINSRRQVGVLSTFFFVHEFFLCQSNFQAKYAHPLALIWLI